MGINKRYGGRALPLTLMTKGVKGDLNGNGQSADAGDLVLMKRASIGEIIADSSFTT